MPGHEIPSGPVTLPVPSPASATATVWPRPERFPVAVQLDVLQLDVWQPEPFVEQFVPESE
jgi:hypothetical protein